MSLLDLSKRHPTTRWLLRWFGDAHHLPPGLPRDVFVACGQLADSLTIALPDGEELWEGLRKLLEAKDCFVRLSVATEQDRTPNSRTEGTAAGVTYLVGESGPELLELPDSPDVPDGGQA